MDEAILNFFRAYALRNSTYEEFEQDVGTMGGSIDGGWIETSRGYCNVSDKEFNPISRIPLKRIWLQIRSGQCEFNF